MKVSNQSDHPVTDEACQAATGQTMKAWFAEFDQMDGLKKGRREVGKYLQDQKVNPWWGATLVVEYENHHGVTKKDGRSEGYTICVTKNISAPVEKVYAVWTDPASFGEMFGDNGRQDAREGGMITCDAGCRATMTRVRPNKDLRFEWQHAGCTAPMTTDVLFQDNKGKTLMNVMTSRIQTRAEADGLRSAWAEFLNHLKAKSEG
jgi:uncharacterized protein YndB with AHSA1/START domain